MGERVLFIEHPTDRSNAVKVHQVLSFSLPWADPQKIPNTIVGPYLKLFFDRAFIDGVHDPSKRPTSDKWESALVKTRDLIQPCQNRDCDQKWYVFYGKTKPFVPIAVRPTKANPHSETVFVEKGWKFQASGSPAYGVERSVIICMARQPTD